MLGHEGVERGDIAPAELVDAEDTLSLPPVPPLPDEVVDEHVDGLGDGFVEEPLLGLEVPEDQRLARLAATRDVADARALVAVRGEELASRIEDRLTCLAPAARGPMRGG